MNAPRSIDEYLKQLRAALADQDPALIQDALYDAEEYLRAEVAAHPDKSEADVLELIASTYGAPEEVATAYKDTEAKVKAALKTPAPASSAPQASAWKRFFGVFLDFRAYSSLFYMLLTLATGILYFTVVVTGLSLSMGLGILIIGIPFFLAFIGITRVISLGEGRLLEAVTGERMPRAARAPGPDGWLADTHRRDAQGRPHLEHAALPAADAAARHRLLHRRDHRAVRRAGLHRPAVRGADTLVRLGRGRVGVLRRCAPRRLGAVSDHSMISARSSVRAAAC